MKLDESIEKRHSVRTFKKFKKVSYKEVLEAVYSATLAPSAGNIQTIKFIFIDNREIIEQLAEASQQPFIKEADYVVAVLSDKRQIIRAYGDRANMYSRQQAGAAIENFLLKITDLGLATCWVGAFSDETVSRILKLPDYCEIEALLPIGYEFAKAKQLKKPNMDSVTFFNEYNNKFMKEKYKPYV